MKQIFAQKPQADMPAEHVAGELSFADLMANFTPRQLIRGEIVTGEVVYITPRGALIDLKMKTEAEIPLDEVEEFGIEVGQVLDVLVTQEPDEIGFTLVSHRYAKGWRRVTELAETGEVSTVTVKRLVKPRGSDYINGVLADIHGMNGFIPYSQLGLKGKPSNNLIGSEIQVKVLKAERDDRNRQKLILSHTAVQGQLREQFVAGLSVGDLVNGVVTSLKDYGAFVRIEGLVDGLLHKSEIGSDYHLIPSELLSAGDELELMVIDIDTTRPDAPKLSLSLKRLSMKSLKDREGEVTRARVVRHVPYGCFLQLDNKVEGLLHLSEYPEGMRQPADLDTGSEVTIRILNVDTNNGRVSFSMKDIQSSAD